LWPAQFEKFTKLTKQKRLQ